jgi:hypothetical protein
MSGERRRHEDEQAPGRGGVCGHGGGRGRREVGDGADEWGPAIGEWERGRWQLGRRVENGPMWVER